MALEMVQKSQMVELSGSEQEIPMVLLRGSVMAQGYLWAAQIWMAQVTKSVSVMAFWKERLSKMDYQRVESMD